MKLLIMLRKALVLLALSFSMFFSAFGGGSSSTANATVSKSTNIVQSGSANQMDAYIYNNMTVGQWKLWTNGTNGGFDGTAATAVISGTALTVTAISANTIAPGQFVTNANATVLPNTTIVSQTSGTPGGPGIYVVSNSQNVSSGALTIGVLLPRTRANFDGDCALGVAPCANHGTWINDAGVAAGGMAGVDGASGVWAYSAPTINTYDGDVCMHGGGHRDSGDGGVYCLNLFANPGVNWSLKVPSARYIGMDKPRPVWSAQTQCSGCNVSTTGTGTSATNTLTVPVSATTATGTSGTNTITVADASQFVGYPYIENIVGAGIPVNAQVSLITGTTIRLNTNLVADLVNTPVTFNLIGNNARIYAVNGAIPTGTKVTGGQGTGTITLSNNLTSAMSGTTVTASTGLWAVTNRDGVPMPDSGHAYWTNVFGSNSDILYMSGWGGFAENGTGQRGSAYAYKPSNGGVNDNILGPFTVANSGSSPPYSIGTISGYIQVAGTIAANDLDGALYAEGQTASTKTPTLFRITTPDTNPTFQYLGAGANASYMAGGPYNNSVILLDPVNGAGHRSYFSHLFNVPNRFNLWNDISGTISHVMGIYSHTFPVTGYLSFAYNSDQDVIAFTNGIDIWEFHINSNFTTKPFVKITATATGDIPTTPMAGPTYGLAALTYLPSSKAYVMCAFKQCTVYKRN